MPLCTSKRGKLVPSPGGQPWKGFRLVLEAVEFSLVSDADAVEDENQQTVSDDGASHQLSLVRHDFLCHI